ncbi:putative alpha beta-hydrolase [Rosellinia necatrix]|uniref:Putative alpha beta-hydrolase n=1 Tax=Rosellinia necatrix TaxID=77044 RepID=A0A1W2TMC6_ROSNE|nr:putative alpha beta-hydrolase [Rosellinia necatrix]
MATPPKQAILIVHGAWHVPESYAKLTTALESSGLEVHIPRLPSVGDVRPPKGDLSSDTKTIRDYAEHLVKEGRTVVALFHSYGGQVGSNALHGLGVEARSAEGLQGGISHLIYMTAYAVAEGTSMIDKVKEFDHMNLIPLAFDIADDSSCASRDPKTLIVSPAPEDDMAEVDTYISTFRRWNAQCMYQAIQHAAWREMPVSYIYTTNDMTVPFDYQKSFVETLKKEGREVQTFELVTGHCPNLTATDAVVDAVKKVISG